MTLLAKFLTTIADQPPPRVVLLPGGTGLQFEWECGWGYRYFEIEWDSETDALSGYFETPVSTADINIKDEDSPLFGQVPLMIQRATGAIA